MPRADGRVLRFPERFLWGVATSSHQVEGGQANDWTDWEAQPGRIADATQSGTACAWWSGRAEEDLARAQSLGLGSVRLSLEWSRIEPAPGTYDEAALARYAAILARCRALDLEPMVGLNHFTLPRWLAHRGGWLAPDAPERFALYAARCGERLGPLVTLWSTLNEPSVLALMAYAEGRWPPGERRPLRAGAALRAQLLAHAHGAHALKRAHPGAKVGLVLNAPAIVPERGGHVGDRLVARVQDWAFTGVVLDALVHARLAPPLSVVPSAVPMLRGSFDWLGLNYYGRYRVRFDPRRPAELFGRRATERSVRSGHVDWGEVAPDGLFDQLCRLRRTFPKTPLYVTENGLFDRSDARRASYIVEHVHAVHRAIERGVDVRGHYVWTLVDNFEWTEGWSAPFGLFALDRDTQVRSARPSAQVVAELCRSHGVPATDGPADARATAGEP